MEWQSGVGESPKKVEEENTLEYRDGWGPKYNSKVGAGKSWESPQTKYFF